MKVRGLAGSRWLGLPKRVDSDRRLAAAKGWKDLVTPGVLVGVFGYAIGTIIATAVYQFWPG